MRTGSRHARARLVIAAAAVALAVMSGSVGEARRGQSPAAPGSAPVAGNAETGKRLYMTQTCYYCHGTAGQGAVSGARLAAPSRPASSFIRYVRRPTGQMPVFTEKILSDQELTDIYAYLKTLPTARPVQDIPLLNQLKKK